MRSADGSESVEGFSLHLHALDPVANFEGAKHPQPQCRLVAIAEGTHPFPFRTRKLSPPAPMVLGAGAPGRVGRCQAAKKRPGLSDRLRLMTNPLALFARKAPGVAC